MLPGNLWSICIDKLTLTTPKTNKFSFIYVYIHILLNADVFSHASGRTVGGVVEQQGCPDLIAAGTFLVLCFDE